MEYIFIMTQFSGFKFIVMLFDQRYKEDQTQVLPTYGVFSYTYYYILHKKTRKIQFYHITDKPENNQRIKRNKKNVCVCVLMLDGAWLVHLND